MRIKLPGKMIEMEDAVVEKLREIGYTIDAQVRAQFIPEIMRIDGVSQEEAFRLVAEDPKYSLGWKLCGCPIIKIATSKKSAEKFREILTPEEDEIFVNEVLKLNLAKMITKEERKQRKEMKKAAKAAKK